MVATSAKQEEVKGLLTVCGGQAFVKDATTSDDAERSKPDPDILTAALEKSGSPRYRAIMIGDTPVRHRGGTPCRNRDNRASVWRVG